MENLKKRKRTGGRTNLHRGKRARESMHYPSESTLGEMKVVKLRGRSGKLKLSARRIDHANVVDPSTGSTDNVKILRVLGNPSNRDYQRRRVITKGAKIETELGVAKVTSRPGQHGMVNALLVR